PGKGCVTLPVDSIEPPVVLLKDNSVVRVTLENFGEVKGKIKKILFLGDILISFGDFLYSNKTLPPSGYVEEWWAKDLQRAVEQKFGSDYQKAADNVQISLSLLNGFVADPFINKPSFRDAMVLSRRLGVPLHPSYLFFWSSLCDAKEVELLRKWLALGDVLVEGEAVCRISCEFNEDITRILRKILVPHTMSDGKILLQGETASALALCLGYGKNIDVSQSSNVLDAVNLLSGVLVKDKAPTYVGGRMGRPEKAKKRDMRPPVHVLFPVNLAGGMHRDLLEAAKQGPVFVDLVKRKCPNCKNYTSKVKCSDCGCNTIKENSCPRCGKALKDDSCPTCKTNAIQHQRQPVNFKDMVGEACKSLGCPAPKMLRGVKGLTNKDKTPEIIEKGILRAKYDLSVYKDGTIRFDATNAPLTHFTPAEVGVPVEKMRQLGYSSDTHGASLTDSNQVCELKIQDIVIPLQAGEYFIQIAAFIDDLLVRVYKLPAYYNIKRPEDLVGHLVFGLAPHTCACILGRIIGYTDRNLIYAHPIWHSAKRRDCDGDEDAIMLALDTLLNFSNVYLPAQIGGIMDAPILLIPFVNTKEVQRQAHDFDVDATYPLEFYQKTWDKGEAKLVSSIMDVISHRLGTDAQFEGFQYTTPVTNINLGNSNSAYKEFKSMIEKLNMQLELGSRIDAVDVKRVALKVLNTHFMRDIAGNLRAFSTQGFRCKSCNKKFRRLPLKGKCPFCDGKLTLTVYRGGIEKYLVAAQQLVDVYGLPKYYTQRMDLIKEEIASMFDNKKPKQSKLFDFS
ncbi:MAG: DNA polymerase II large subunit, partial [Candidatus Bathyarchaeia archaeon]